MASSPAKTLRGLSCKTKGSAEGRNPEASFAARLPFVPATAGEPQGKKPCPYKAGPKDRRLSWVRKSALHTSTPSGRAAVKKDKCRFLVAPKKGVGTHLPVGRQARNDRGATGSVSMKRKTSRDKLAAYGSDIPLGWSDSSNGICDWSFAGAHWPHFVVSNESGGTQRIERRA